MKDQIQNRWIVAGILWAGVLCLVYWNGSLMADIRRNQENALYAQADNRFLTDSRFLESNAEKISDIIKKKEAFHQPIISLKLGLLSVEDRFNTLTASYNLSDVKINISVDQPGNDSAPIQLSFKGSVENTIRCLDILQKDSPYFLIDKAILKMDKTKHEIDFSISLTYMYQLVSPADAALPLSNTLL